MKNFLHALAMLCLLYSFQAQAQTTYSGNLIFNSQTDLDSFPSNYTNVTGNVYIHGADITDLSSLNNIQTIGLDLLVSGNSSLTNFDGLNNLTSVGDDITISSNSSLTEISGLNNLASVAGFFNIQFNTSLTSISGFAQLNSVSDYFKLYYNEKLSSVTGFNSLSYFGDDVDIYRCNLISSFQFFSSVTSISGNLSIENNNVITSLVGFENLVYVGELLSLEYLSKVSDLDVFSNLTSVGTGITISNNTVLENINGLGNITFSSSPTIYIRFNKQLTTLAPLSFLTGTIRNLIIQSNDEITDLLAFSGVTNIQYRLSISEKNIISLDGFNNITYIGDDIEISSCEELESTSALSNLTVLGGDINIRFNKELKDISMLNNLSFASGDLELMANEELSDLTPLSNLTSVADEFYIRDNAIETLAGLESLEAVGKDFVLLVNRDLEDISALRSLVTVGKRLRIISNNELGSLKGLDSLKTISNHVEIYSNEELEDINALQGIESVGGDFSIYDNEELDDCCVLLDFIINPDLVAGEISIYDNDENCNSATTISDLCDDIDGDGVTKTEGDCDDNNDQVFPGNIEICDGIDNDCNGLIDDEDPNVTGQPIWYADVDEDGLGDSSVSVRSCEQPEGYVNNDFDNCVDSENPNQEDDDCDGVGNTCDQCHGGDDKQDSDNDGTPDCAEWEYLGDPNDFENGTVDKDNIVWGNIEDLPANFICGNNDHKILVCRVKEWPNKPTKYITRCVREGRVNKILARGGYLGACEAVSCGGGQGLIVVEENELAEGRNTPAPAVEFQNDLTLFPNPALNEVSIFVKKSNNETASGTISIISSSGQIIQQIPSANIGEEIKINLNDVKIGVYFVIVKIENEEPLTKRLVVMK